MKNIMVAGAGGFIGGWLTKKLLELNHKVVAVDIKPINKWYQKHNTTNLNLDLNQYTDCKTACRNIDEVYDLSANMGGMGFIEKNRVECLRNILISSNLLEASYNAGVQKFFFASSACVYNTNIQSLNTINSLKEEDAYPAMSERGYGWEKLMSEMFCQEYWHERKMETYIARFHNVYGPHGSWNDGREKAPAAICRKVAEAKYKKNSIIEIWGDGEQVRSFQYIDDCINGILKITNCKKLIANPINLGSSEAVTINQLVDVVCDIAKVKLEKKYIGTAPKGVGGRNSDNTKIFNILKWEPNIKLVDGLIQTYNWIEKEYLSAVSNR